jgi:hypothetical protein
MKINFQNIIASISEMLLDKLAHNRHKAQKEKSEQK